jgi:excisionase family DNA binding protein
MTGARLLTVPQAAERLAYSRATVNRLIRAGRLRAVRIGAGSPWRIPEDAIGEFIAQLDSNMDGAA